MLCLVIDEFDKVKHCSIINYSSIKASFPGRFVEQCNPVVIFTISSVARPRFDEYMSYVSWEMICHCEIPAFSHSQIEANDLNCVS